MSNSLLDSLLPYVALGVGGFVLFHKGADGKSAIERIVPSIGDPTSIISHGPQQNGPANSGPDTFTLGTAYTTGLDNSRYQLTLNLTHKGPGGAFAVSVDMRQEGVLGLPIGQGAWQYVASFPFTVGNDGSSNSYSFSFGPFDGVGLNGLLEAGGARVSITDPSGTQVYIDHQQITNAPIGGLGPV